MEDHRGLTWDEAQEIAAARGEKVVQTFCGMCGPQFNCRIYAFTKDGKMTRTMGAAEGIKNRGAICAKGLAAAQWVHSPDRIKTPLLRIGERGEGKFKPISWDEAIQRIADKLKEQKEKYGPESLALLSPAGRYYKDISIRFLTVHGSPNNAHSGICAMQRAFGFSYTLGSRPNCDIEKSDLIIYWARQPVLAGPAMDSARSLREARKRGAQIVMVKPSKEADSAAGDIWIPLRPGTDAALALSMLHVIIDEEIYDKEFTEKWCYGFDQFRDHVKQYTPEWGEKITGVPAEQITDFARLYANTKAACIDLGNGVEHAPSSSDAIRAVSILMAITGHLDRPGCNIFAGKPAVPQPKSVMRRDLYTPEMIEKLVAPEFPKPFQPFLEGLSSQYYKTIESILTEKPFPIRTLIAPGTQPLVSNRGTRKVLEALKKVDFFVCVDVAKTAEKPYADIVVPTTTPYEQDHPFGMMGNAVLPTNRVIEPQGDYKSIFEFFIDLAVALGYGDDFWQGSMDACENERLEPLGLTVDDLRQNPQGIRLEGKGGPFRYEKYEETFGSPSFRLSKAPNLPQGKVALYSTEFEKAGYPAMPEWREPPESLTATPELAADYPLILSDYHTTKAYSASWLRNIPALRAEMPEPSLNIHPDAAKARGIADGDWVKLKSPHGWLKVRAEYYEGIRPDTVMIAHGWWQGCPELGFEDQSVEDGGANVNLLYSTEDSAFDPLVAAPSSQTLVEVTKYE